MKTAPRVVKTYQERLAEMKTSQTTFTKPIVPHLHRPSDSNVALQQQQVRAAGSQVKPRKTMTYSQQLQQLQPPKKPVAIAGE